MGEMIAFVRSERAVSPVIGVILVVAVTVTLAAIIGSFVLSVGSSQETVPQAKFTVDTVDTDGDGVVEAANVTHAGGQAFEEGTLTVSVAGDEPTWNPTSEVTVGDTFVVADSGSSLASAADHTVSSVDGETLQLVYATPEEDRGVVIVSQEVTD